MQQPDIARELEQMCNVDQQARKVAIATGDFTHVAELDVKHTQRLQEIVSSIGWPTASLVGVDGAHYAWLLVQHADHNLHFQQYCLDLMKTAGHNEVSQQDIAYLEDRVLLAQGKEQEWGTQFQKDQHGNWHLRPTRDRTKVNERRKAIGLKSVEENLQQLIAYHKNLRGKSLFS